MEALRHTHDGTAPPLRASIDACIPNDTSAADALHLSPRRHFDAAKFLEGGAAASEGAAAGSDAAAKRPRRENESQCEEIENGGAASACFAEPIPHTHSSAPIDLAAMDQQAEALGHAVRQLKAEQAAELAQATALSKCAAIAGAGAAAATRATAAEARSAEAQEAPALRELERAIEASHPAVPALVLGHSELCRILSDCVGSGLEQAWAHCLHGCPVQPQERCLDIMSLLAQLQQAPDPPAYRVFHVLSKPLFDCLEHVSDADLADMQQAAEYVQLPKPLLARVAQHAEARALRLARTSPVALPAALKGGVLSPLVDACLAATPPLFNDAQPGLTFLLEDEALQRVSMYHLPVRTPATERRRMLGNPYFLHGLCGAPWAWLPGCTDWDSDTAYVAGLLLAGHPLPARLCPAGCTVTAAVAAGNGAALKRLVADDTDSFRDGNAWRTTAPASAAHFGRTDMIEWLIGESSPSDEKNKTLSCAANWAAAAGHLPALQQLLSAGGDFDVLTTAAAAVSRHGLPLLQYLRAAGCPWDGNTLAQAAAGGHQELLEWAIAEGCPKDARACAAAATGGNLPLLQWLQEQGFPWDVRCYIAAAENRRFDIMRYLRENGCDWGSGDAVCEAASLGGSLELLQWCIENGAAWSSQACNAAAAGGHLDVLMYAHGNGCQLNEWTACAAAQNGHAACLAWIFENDGGHLTHGGILSSALLSRQVDCVKLALEHGCEEYCDPADFAGQFGDVEFVRWLMERAVGKGDGSDAWVASQICAGAARRGQLQVLDFMLAAGHLDRNSAATASAAVFHGDDSLSTLAWLLEHDVRFDASVFAAAANTSGVDTLVWLRDVAHCPWDASACRAAAAGRYKTERVATLQWLVQAGCPLGAATWEAAGGDARKWLCVQPVRPWDDKLVLWALRRGNEALAEWALANEPDAASALKTRGCEEAIKCDAGFGDDGADAIAMVTWARARGGEWSSVCSNALATGTRRFELVQRCVRDGCGVVEAMLNHAAGEELYHWDVLRAHLTFLKQQGCPWSAATVAAAVPTFWNGRHLDIVEWLMDHGCPYDASACAAAAGTSLPLSMKLHEMGLPLDGSVCVAAAQAGELDTLRWAHSKGCPLDACADLVVPEESVREWLFARGVACRSA